MAGDLVTIATFDQAAKARLAQNALTEAGIKATVADETTVGMDWLLGNAIGWVKVQVLDEDAERAVAVLERALGPEDGAVDPEELAAQAEGAAFEEGAEPAPEPKLSPAEPSGDGRAGAPSERDEYARRLFFIAWLGLLVLPLALLALCFFLKGALGTGPLSARGRYNLYVGGLVTVLALPLSLLICAGFGGIFR